MEFLKSALSLFSGTLKRAWWYLPPLLLDPFDLAERLFKMNYQPPQWIAWSLFGFGWFMAIVLTYHELRKQKVILTKQLDGLQNRRDVKKSLDGFIGEGNHILSILTAESLDAIDRYNDQMNEWATHVRKLLSEISYENYWMSNPGLVKEEPEYQQDFIKQSLAIMRNYMKIRLQRLQEIRRKLGD